MTRGQLVLVKELVDEELVNLEREQAVREQGAASDAFPTEKMEARRTDIVELQQLLHRGLTQGGAI